MTKAKKISLLISIVLIIAGAVIFAIMGFNYDLSYGTAKRIIVPMKNEFAIEDYKNIAKEIYGNASIEKISIFGDGVSIKVKDTNDEQLNNLISKVNEKYGYEYTKDDITVTELAKVEVFDILEQCIVPVLTTLLIVLAYMIIRYRKMGLVKVIFNLFVPAILIELLVLAIYLVCRIPVNNMLLPVVLSAYFISLLYSAKQCKN